MVLNCHCNLISHCYVVLISSYSMDIKLFYKLHKYTELELENL